MSRTDDYGLTNDARDLRDRTPSAPDRATEIGSRMGVSRETAHAEMERFRGVAEYEVRKVFGQRSALREPIEEPIAKGPAKRSKPRRTSTVTRGSSVPHNHTAQPTPSQSTVEHPTPETDAPTLG